MAGKASGLDVRLQFSDDYLVSDEKLERNSPLLWPENSLFGDLNPVMLPSTPELPKYWISSGPHSKDNADEKLLHELGILSNTELKEKVKMLKKLAYQLEQEETKEIQRTKCLDIFKDV